MLHKQTLIQLCPSIHTLSFLEAPGVILYAPHSEMRAIFYLSRMTEALRAKSFVS